jgi:hypothetical protein
MNCLAWSQHNCLIGDRPEIGETENAPRSKRAMRIGRFLEGVRWLSLPRINDFAAHCVGTFGKEFNAALKKAGLGGNDSDAWMNDEDSIKVHEVRAVARIGVGVPKLSQNPFGGDDLDFRVAGELGCLPMECFARIEQGKKIERVREDRSHRFGSPPT